MVAATASTSTARYPRFATTINLKSRSLSEESEEIDLSPEGGELSMDYL